MSHSVARETFPACLPLFTPVNAVPIRLFAIFGGRMLRSVFIGLSESKGLRHFAENPPLGLRFSQRFVAGTHLKDVIHAAEVVNEWGAVSASITSAKMSPTPTRRSTAPSSITDARRNQPA